jgi:CRP-like cAMP-binding protein
MTMEELLHSHRLLSGLRPEDIDIITWCSRNRAFAPGEMLFREGQVADTLYLVHRGNVSVDVHQPGQGTVVIETIGTGAVVGWSWIVAPYRWTFDARAIDEVGVIAIDSVCLRTKAIADPAFGVALLSRVATEILDRLQSTRLRLLDLYGAPRDDN